MKEIDVSKLKSMKENNEKFILLDVRENNEIDFANISPHVHISIGEIPNRYKELDENRKILAFPFKWEYCCMCLKNEDEIVSFYFNIKQKGH